MATTTNFGWETPDDTDLVKDGALAMRTLGNSIDTSFVDLKGGTTGQILSKASNTDLDYTWINNDQGDITGVTAGTGISGGGTSGTVTITNSMATEITAAGDIIIGTGSGTFDNLPIGTTGQVLTADTTVSPYKVKWASAGGGFPTHVGCLTYKTGSQSLSNANQTYISFDAEVYDTDAIHNNSTNNGRLTVPTGNGGYWFIYALGSYDTSTGGGNRMNSFIVNRTTEFGTYAVLNPANAAQRQEVLSFAVRNLSAGDYVELLCAQYSGGTINLNGGNENSSRFGMYRLSQENDANFQLT